jgi:hypothetical protein
MSNIAHYTAQRGPAGFVRSRGRQRATLDLLVSLRYRGWVHRGEPDGNEC